MLDTTNYDRKIDLPSQKRVKEEENKIKYSSKKVEEKKYFTYKKVEDKKQENKESVQKVKTIVMPIKKKVKVLLNGRKDPNYSDNIIETYQAGTVLEIIEEQDGWGKTTKNTYVRLEFTE